MRYLITQQWNNLKGNHAGYPHICHLLEKKYPNKYFTIEIPDQGIYNTLFKNKYLKIIEIKCKSFVSAWRYKSVYKKYCYTPLSKLKAGDEVFLLEYNYPELSQVFLAKYLRHNYPFVRIYAMTHLTPITIQKKHNWRKRLMEWDSCVDKHLTLGSSLSAFLIESGINNNKVSTGFHAVDTDYYRLKKNIGDNLNSNKKFVVICLGFQQRNYELLFDIINRCKDVRWIVCHGRSNVDKYILPSENVTLKGYVSEEELKLLLESADFSLNVMNDTIGSNVITMSMAMGLGLFVSDVGSIRDYCDSHNAVFCKNTVDDFVEAINTIAHSPEIIKNMRIASLEKVKDFTVEKTDLWFDTLK